MDLQFMLKWCRSCFEATILLSCGKVQGDEVMVNERRCCFIVVVVDGEHEICVSSEIIKARWLFCGAARWKRYSRWWKILMKQNVGLLVTEGCRWSKRRYAIIEEWSRLDGEHYYIWWVVVLVCAWAEDGGRSL